MTYEQREFDRLVHGIPDRFKHIKTMIDKNRDLHNKLFDMDATLTYEEAYELGNLLCGIWANAVSAQMKLEEAGVGDKKRKIFMLEHLKFWKK